MTTKLSKPSVKVQDANVVKIAVEMEGQVAQLFPFNQTIPLANIIHEICTGRQGWGLPDPDQYALQFSEKNYQKYITENNRTEIKNGSILRLTYSAARTAQDILAKLCDASSIEEKTVALNKLSQLSHDITFAMEFINKQGLHLIIKLIESNKCKPIMLSYCLVSFVELMDHGIISWDILDVPFINRIAEHVNDPNSIQESEIIRASLSILESIALNSTGKFSHVEKVVTLTLLVKHLQNQNSIIQQNAIALINALFIKAEPSKRQVISATMCSKSVRNGILKCVLQPSSGQVGAEMAHQLYVLQTLTLGLLEQRMNTKLDHQDQDAHEKIKELRRVAFESDMIGGTDTSSKRQTGFFSKDYKKLGFKNVVNPALDFTETPPGMLALDCMIYFERVYTESYTKVVLENSCRADEHECPFGRTSVELVKLLCEILRIGDVPNEQGVNYHPMFFTHDQPFEEFYCICIVSLNKTWIAMRATTEDFVKVFSVVREQITRALNSQPINLDQFKDKIAQLTYSEITNLWQQERTTREEGDSHAKPIVELKELITPEIVDLIKQQRLGYLVDGTRFTKYSAKGQRVKDKFWYVRLSPNYKVLHYGDCDEKSVPILEHLPSKLPVSDIKALLIGKDCPHLKDVRGGRKIPQNLAFSLTIDSSEMGSLDFVAPEEEVFDYWTDGINALLRNKMTSKKAEKDLETLLSMEIKIRLLDIEGIEIPHDPPVVPEDPPYDFNF